MGRIEDDGVPLQHRHVGAGGLVLIGAGVARGGEKVERYFELGDAGRHLDVDTVHIDVITAPGESPDRWRESTIPARLSMGPVGRWSPGIHCGYSSVRGPARHGYLQMSMQQMARRIGEIYMQENRGGRGRVRTAMRPAERRSRLMQARPTKLLFISSIISQRDRVSSMMELIPERGFPMANATPQSYANHARLDPPFHFFLAPLGLAAIILSVILFVQHPGMASSLWVAFWRLDLFMIAGKARSYALKVQDRVIRLEERLRLSMLLPEADEAADCGADRVSVDRASFRLGCGAACACHAGAERRPDQQADKDLDRIVAR